MTSDGSKPIRILLVDDHRDMVLATRVFLEGEGFEVMEAFDGIQALELLKAERPDLIVLDVMMPRLDGWSTLARIQADERTKDIPVVMLTALKEASSVRTGIDLGCTWYYTKPISDYADFALVIQRILQGLEPPAAELEDW
jgi:CheY-like chemotaxis protein